jgi:hypothetical protein
MNELSSTHSLTQSVRFRRFVDSLAPGDARIGWISVSDAKFISRACDRWLEKRGLQYKKFQKKN